jgi:hypothetical protein
VVRRQPDGSWRYIIDHPFGSDWAEQRPYRGREEERMAKFETVPIGELKHRLPAKLLPLVEEYRDKLEKLTAEQGGRLTLEKGDDPKDLRRALKAAATSLNRRIRFPFRGEEGSLSFYLEGKRGRRGRRPRGEAAAAGGEAPKRRRGRPRKGD